MPYSQEIANKILEFAKIEPTIPSGNAHDLELPDFDQEDVKDTAKHLIASGQIKAQLKEFYSGLVIAFRK